MSFFWFLRWSAFKFNLQKYIPAHSQILTYKYYYSFHLCCVHFLILPLIYLSTRRHIGNHRTPTLNYLRIASEVSKHQTQRFQDPSRPMTIPSSTLPHATHSLKPAPPSLPVATLIKAAILPQAAVSALYKLRAFSGRLLLYCHVLFRITLF